MDRVYSRSPGIIMEATMSLEFLLVVKLIRSLSSGNVKLEKAVLGVTTRLVERITTKTAYYLDTRISVAYQRYPLILWQPYHCQLMWWPSIDLDLQQFVVAIRCPLKN